MSKGFDLNLTAARPALLAGHDNVVDVLIRIQAPDQPKEGLPERQSLNLAIVVDRSGSMSGRPLHEAKRAATFMIDNLKSTDRAALVVYDESVDVLIPSQQVENKARLKTAIAGIHSGGSTNLHGGWLRGAEEAAGHLDRRFNSRVLLLSDGQANAGLTDNKEIATQCAKLADAGVSTSTYGLGENFNEELMVTMARSGRGNGYYSETADTLLERFQEEFSLLSALCARNVRLYLSPLPGVRCEMLNLYEESNDGSWRMPDLAYDGEAWAAVRLHADSASLPVVGETLALLQAYVAYEDLEGSVCKIPEIWFTLPVFENAKFFALEENADVLRRVTDAEAARLQEAASRAARQGDWNEVQAILSKAREMAKRSPWLDEIVAYLEGLAAQRNQVLFSKEARYAAANLSTRQRPKSEFDASFDNASLPLFQRIVTRQGASRQFSTKTHVYQLDRFDNYPVAVVDGMRILLDTGSPFSVGNGKVEIAGRQFNLGSQMGITVDQLSRWMNTKIDALIGSDVLSDFAVSMDWWQSSVAFLPKGTALAGAELAAGLLMGTPVLEFSAAGRKAKGVFDTGAKLCYAPESALSNLVPVNHIHDLHPMTGPFETDVFELNVEVGGHTFVANCGVLPKPLGALLGGMTGIEWVIGADLLRQGTIGLDLCKGRLTAVWKP